MPSQLIGWHLVSRQAYRTRLAETRLDDNLAALGAVLLEGVKGSGKTELARQRAKSEVLLDTDAQARDAAQLDPALILAGPTPRLIDEWQLVPAVWNAVRRAVDDRADHGQFILTGSATRPADATLHSGSGRFAVQRIRTMTLHEQGVGSPAISVGALLAGEQPTPAQSDVAFRDYVERIVVGGWPQLLNATSKNAADFLEGYLHNVVDRDVEMATGTHRDPDRLTRFLVAYAQMSAQPATMAAILKRVQGNDPGPALSRVAADPYLDALRRLMIVDEIDAWSPSLRSRARLVGQVKRNFADPSLAANLLRASPDRLINDLNTLGFLFESMVAHEFRTFADVLRANLYHYREESGRSEIDLVIENRDGAWIGIEVKLGARDAIAPAAENLRTIADTKIARPPAALLVVTTGSYALPLGKGVWEVPLALLGP